MNYDEHLIDMADENIKFAMELMEKAADYLYKAHVKLELVDTRTHCVLAKKKVDGLYEDTERISDSLYKHTEALKATRKA